MPQPFIVEPGKYGDCLVLQGDWDDRIADHMCRRGIEELVVNYARGFTGGSLTFLERVPFLKSLLLITYHIDDISPIHALHELRAIDIGSRPERTPIDFRQFPHLEDCGLEWRPGARSLFGCTTLKRLWLNKYSGKDTADFSGLAGLDELHIASAPVADLGGLGQLSKLRKLGLYYLRRLSSLRGIKGLCELAELEIDTCRQITAVDEIGHLSNLRRLILGNCGDIATLGPIAELPHLRDLFFYNSTNIVDGDIGVLERLPALGGIAFQNRRHYNRRCEDFPQWPPKA